MEKQQTDTIYSKKLDTKFQLKDHRVPKLGGNAGKAMTVNERENGFQFKEMTDNDYKHTPNSNIHITITSTTFTAGKNCSQMISVANDIEINIISNNKALNMLWVKNTGASNITATIANVSYNGNVLASTAIYRQNATTTVPPGKTAQYTIATNQDGCFITETILENQQQ